MKEIQDLRQFTSLGFTNLQDHINKIFVNQGNLEEVPESSQVNEKVANLYLNSVSRVIFQKWEVFLTIVINDKFVLDTVALIDSRTASNCQQEGLVPTQFYEKTKQALSGTNGKRLTLVTKVTKTFVLSKPSF